MNLSMFSGAVDVIVIQQQNETLQSTPIHAVFSACCIVSCEGTEVNIAVNGNSVTSLQGVLTKDGKVEFIQKEVCEAVVSSNDQIHSPSPTPIPPYSEDNNTSFASNKTLDENKSSEICDADRHIAYDHDEAVGILFDKQVPQGYDDTNHVKHEIVEQSPDKQAKQINKSQKENDAPRNKHTSNLINELNLSKSLKICTNVDGDASSTDTLEQRERVVDKEENFKFRNRSESNESSQQPVYGDQTELASEKYLINFSNKYKIY